MMAKKDRLPSRYSSGFVPHHESEGSGCSGRFDSIKDSSAPTRKFRIMNSASNDGLSVPIQNIPVSELSSSERKNLVIRLTAELGQIRILLNKFESRKIKAEIATTKSSYSDIINSKNAQPKRLQLCNAKKSSGLGPPGPGKKGHGLNRNNTGRYQPSTQNIRANGNANVDLLKQCKSLLKKLLSQPYAWVFNTPVDAVKLNIPDYYDVIKNPMDLGTIKSKLASGKYSSPLDFLADVRLTFTNAKTYNPPGSDVHIMADTMSQFFESNWKVIGKKLVARTSQSLPESSRSLGVTEINKSPSKKRELSPRSNEVMQEPIKRKMTEEEKHKLSSELEDFTGDLPDSIIDFLRAHTTTNGDGGEDEIEIDIDSLRDDTLFALRKLLDDHSLEKHKSLATSDACEIELPNVSGLSNSSLKVEKGNDPIDEDVDIGGSETPVTSCNPLLIDKEKGGRAEEYNEEASVNELDQLAAQGLQVKPPCSSNSDGESAQNERQVSPDKLYRAALLKNRFADTILKAREKTLISQDDTVDPEKLRREKEELEIHKKREKARLQAEAKAAEDARKQAEAEAAAEAKKRREFEREAAREALLKMEKTVEINENSKFLEDLEMLRTAEQLPTSVDEELSQNTFGNYTFGGSGNPLEKLGLYMKVDDEEEEADPRSIPNVTVDVEEGQTD